jgi:hypothetical protein
MSRDGIQEVDGSIPFASTNIFNGLEHSNLVLTFAPCNRDRLDAATLFHHKIALLDSLRACEEPGRRVPITASSGPSVYFCCGVESDGLGVDGGVVRRRQRRAPAPARDARIHRYL